MATDDGTKQDNAANPDTGNQGTSGTDTQNQDDKGKGTGEGSPDAGAGADPFTELETDTREWLTKREIKDLKGLGKLAHEQSKLLGSAIRVPGKDAKPEEVQEYLNKLGRPEAPDKYEFQVPKDLPEEVPYDADRATEFKQLAHEIGLTQAQAQRLHDWVAKNAVGDFNVSQEASNQRKVETAKSETQKLIKLWGPLDGDTMKANMSFADRALQLAFPPEALSALQQAELIGQDGKVVQSAPLAIGLANIGRALYKEDTVLRGDPDKMNNPFVDGPGFNMTEQMRMIKADQQTALAFIAAAGKKPTDFGLTA